MDGLNVDTTSGERACREGGSLRGGVDAGILKAIVGECPRGDQPVCNPYNA